MGEGRQPTLCLREEYQACRMGAHNPTAPRKQGTAHPAEGLYSSQIPVALAAPAGATRRRSAPEGVAGHSSWGWVLRPVRSEGSHSALSPVCLVTIAGPLALTLAVVLNVPNVLWWNPPTP